MCRYTKPQLEELFYRQYEYIEQLNDQIKLLKEQNAIYSMLNKKLTEEQLNGKTKYETKYEKSRKRKQY